MNFLLEIARGVAALMVFLFHVRLAFEPSWPALAEALTFTNLRMPLLFVVSGYGIFASAESLIRKGDPASEFLKRRFMRIVPPFWLAILVILPMPYIVAAVSALKSGVFVMPNPRYWTLSASDWLALVTLWKVFMAPDGDLQAQFNPVNSVYWTLAIEVQFYLCVYFALLFRKHFRHLLAAVTALSVVSLLWSLPLNSGLFIHFWPMFAIGIGLRYVIHRGWGAQPLLYADPRRLLPLGVGCVLVVEVFAALEAGVLAERVVLSRDVKAAFFCALVLWLLEPGAVALGKVTAGPALWVNWLLRPLAYLGMISYSVYLLHAVVVQLPAMFVRQLVPLDNILNPLLSVVATLVFCAWFHRLAERPFMSRHRQRTMQAERSAYPLAHP